MWPLGKYFGHLVARIGEHVTSEIVWVGGVGEGGGGGGWRQQGGVEERLDGDKVALRTSTPAVLSSVGTFIKEGKDDDVVDCPTQLICTWIFIC